jgi:hypothetical protein
MKKRSLLLVILLISIVSKAQKQSPSTILWKSLKSEHFELVFPYEIENEAQRIANTLEWVYPLNTKSLDVQPKPVSLVLYNRSNTSNAFAGLAPRRMGWYLTPPQTVTNLGSIDWVQTLSIHEYRHIVQYAKNKQHFTRFMTYLFGDMGQFMMRWSIPDWYFEGDAIVMETALTKGGRGRIPAFAMNIRTYLLTNEKFTYDQAYLGSYKRYYPSHYHLGYPLTACGRVNYGTDIWDQVLTRTNKISWWPYAFGSSLKKYTGSGLKKFYKKAMSEYDTLWKKQDSLIQPTEFRKINTKKKKNYTNYLNPKYSNSGSIICKRGSLDKIAAFYEVKPDGTERKIKETDANLFDLNNDILCWTRTIPDIRWGERSYADIVLLGLTSNAEKRLTFKRRYLSPALSPNGKTIVAVEHDSLQKSQLVLIDVESGKLKEVIPQPDGFQDYYRTPAWSEDGRYIAYTHAKYKGPALSIYDTKTKELKKILDYDWDNIGQPVFYKNYVLYNSDYSGIGNINAVDINTGQRFQVTSSRFGAYNADVSPDGKKMIYQEYTKNGFDIAEIDVDPTKWKKVESVVNTEPGYYQSLVEQEGGQTIDEAVIPEKKYPVERYKKFKDAIKFHSWGPFAVPPYIYMRLISNNYLNTIALTGGYLYNTNEKTSAGYVSFTYSKFYPILSVTSTFGEMKQSYQLENGVLDLNWKELSVKAGLSVPFNFSRNVTNTTLSIGGGLEFTYVDEKPVRYLDETFTGNFTPLYASVSFMNYRNYAWRDFAPKFGQFINFDYKRIMPYDDRYEGYLFSARGNFYFPGLLANNSIKVGAAYEKQLSYDENNRDWYYFSKKTSFARGYTSVTLDQFNKLSVDYQLPLWSPDLSLGPLAYIKRIRLGGFYDYAGGSLGDSNVTYESVGGSIRFEFNVFRIRYPLELGVQYAHRLADGDYRISILILGLPI